MNGLSKIPQVLLVEDSPEDVFFFERALRKSGAEVSLTVVTDGRAAVDALLAGKHRPELVFLDLKLPLLNGFDVLRWIRQQNFSPPMPVVVLSGSSHEKDQSLAAELGAVEYLVKPISPEQLRARLLGNQSNQ